MLTAGDARAQWRMGSVLRGRYRIDRVLYTRLQGAVALLLVTVTCVAGGCARDLASLLPFPCADDGTCPDGFACNSADPPGLYGACELPHADTICGQPAMNNFVDCTLAGSGFACTDNLCVPPCGTNGATCPEGRGCIDDTYCLLVCTQSQSCPAGLVCKPDFKGNDFCLPPGSIPFGGSPSTPAPTGPTAPTSGGGVLGGGVPGGGVPGVGGTDAGTAATASSPPPSSSAGGTSGPDPFSDSGRP